MDDEFASHLQELRRGTVVLACLHLLHTPGYGYGLLQDLDQRGFTSDANTLYPLLRRLQKQGYLTSEWNTDEARPRKLYRTSPQGEQLGEALRQEWHSLSEAIAQLTQASTSPASGRHTDPAAAPPNTHVTKEEN